MRARDRRAIAFCIVTTLVLLVGTMLLTRNALASLALTAAYSAWILSRPRMLRVFRRLSGAPDWSGYIDEDGTRIRWDPGPGTAASSPRPTERR